MGVVAGRQVAAGVQRPADLLDRGAQGELRIELGHHLGDAAFVGSGDLDRHLVGGDRAQRGQEERIAVGAGELEAALKDSQRQTVSTLIDIKVLPKSMTEGYGGWWRVGVAEVSERERVKNARADQDKHLNEARKY